MFFRCLSADFFKMKRSAVLIAHIVIPIIVSLAFIFYYAVSGGGFDEIDKITAFYETIGSAFPILIGIFTASTMEQEQNAGAFQNLLSMKNRTAALFSKVVILVLLSFFALMFTAVLFGYGFDIVLGQGSVDLGVFMAAALVMWLFALPLYFIFGILAFLFGKGVSIGAGLFSGLISALLMTNLGTYVWKIVPLSWTARMPDMYLKLRLLELSVTKDAAMNNMLFDSAKIHMSGSFEGLGVLSFQLPKYLIFTGICLLAYYIFAVNYEGSKATD